MAAARAAWAATLAALAVAIAVCWAARFSACFFRLLSGGLPLLDIFLHLRDILFGGLYSLTALLIKLVDSFMAYTIHTG